MQSVVLQFEHKAQLNLHGPVVVSQGAHDGCLRHGFAEPGMVDSTPTPTAAANARGDAGADSP